MRAWWKPISVTAPPAAGAAARGENPRARVRHLPPACGAPGPERRSTLRRRAADARDRARPDGGTETADSRRAFARPLAAAGGRAVFADQEHQPAGYRA